MIINHYEIKEIRDLLNEEIKDKRDWENYVARNGAGAGLQMNNMLNNQGGLTHIIQQLLQIMQTQQPNMNRGGFNNQQRQGYNPNFQQNRQNPRQGGQQRM